MGSKKRKKRSRSKFDVGHDNGAVRKAQPDMSKYAGAVSNKSRRNYADLKLVRPDNLTDYVSDSSRRRKRSSDESSHAAEPAERVKNTSASRRKSSPPGVKKSASSPPTGRSDERYGKSNGRLSGKKNGKAKPQKRRSMSSSSEVKKKTDDKYIQDEYSKALNKEDFYSSVIEKYYLKHPEEQQKREKSGTVRKKKRSADRMRNSQSEGKVDKISSSDSAEIKSSVKSVAQMAVDGRGSANKKNRARVVKNGKARGIVSSHTAHRRVRQRNRRRTVIFNSIMIMSTVVFLIAVYVTVFFNVKKIEIKGESPYDAKKVSDMCNFKTGDNILFVDAKGSENKIIQNLPYIESCTIKRKLPATVVVNVTEADTLGVAEISANQWAMLSTKGKILEVITNSTVVSSSDIITSLTYDPDVSSIDDVASKRGVPVLEGIGLSGGTAGNYVDKSSVKCLDYFEKIYSSALSMGMSFTRIKLGDRGYEAEYDGRINIVLGDVSDEKVMNSHIATANHIIRVRGDITEHERGEITYLNNETFYNPTYDKDET